LHWHIAPLEAPMTLGKKATRVNSIAQRAERLAFAAACAAHQQDVIDFWYRTMMDDRVEMQHRITCSVHLMDRGYGKTVQVTQESVTENRRTFCKCSGFRQIRTTTAS
jgi:hypothetical protein